MRGKVFGALLAFTVGHALADGCVVGTEITNIRPDGVHAVSSVFSVHLYADIRSCNDALSYQARNLPETAAAKANLWDSLTFDCHVPGSCYPADQGAVEPFSRVVYVSRGSAQKS